MKRRRVSTGSAYEELVGYSRALAAGDWVFVSGTTGRNYETGEIPEDVVEQTHLCFKTIAWALAEAHGAQALALARLAPEGAPVKAQLSALEPRLAELEA